MGRADYFKKGDYNAICDWCGQKFKMSKLKNTWDGLLVCERDFEIRNPQDFVRSKPDPQSVPASRPDTTPTFNEVAESLPLPPPG
jgi:hypothetical protein